MPNGGTLYLPGGTFRYTKNLNINKRITLLGSGHSNGDGKGATVLLKDGNFKAVWASASAVAIRNLTLRGVTGNSDDGVYITGGRVKMNDVEIINMGGHAIRIGNETAETTYNANLFYLSNIIVVGCKGNGLHVNDKNSKTLPNAGAGSVFQIDVRSCGGHGVFLDSCIDVCIYNAVSQMNTGWGIKLGPNCKSAKFYGQYTEFDTAGEIWIQPGARRNYFFGQSDNHPLHVILLDEGKSTFFLGRDNNNEMLAINKVQVEKLQISKSDVSGRWNLSQNASNGDLEVEMVRSSDPANNKFEKSS
ncbi:hypothetical protein ABEY80_15825 [Priestia megaterium]